MTAGPARHADLHRQLSRCGSPGACRRRSRPAPANHGFMSRAPDEISPAWEAALVGFERELRTRGASRHTLRAYAADLSELASWATARRQRARRARAIATCAPMRRHCRSGAWRRPRSPESSLRSGASTITSCGPKGAHNPGELLPSPKRGTRLPRVLSPDRVAALLERIPASSPLELRDRALFELVYACGLRAEETVNLDLDSPDFESEALRVVGKGSKTRIVPMGEPAQRALERYLERRDRRSRRTRGRRRSSSRAEGGGSRPPTCGAGSSAGCGRRPSPDTSRPTPCGTRSRPICSREGRTCARSRSFSATRASRPRRSTRGWSRNACAASTLAHIRAPEPRRITFPTTMETNVKAVELRDLWRRYKEQGDERARERLVVAYSPLVKFIAGRMASGLPSHVEEGDLISYGLLGLIGAIERFDLEREIKFETFAVARVKGAIIDELRSLDWVPRSVRARARDVERAHAKLEAKLQRAPTDEEMAEQLEMTVEEFQDALLEIANSSVLALDDLWTFADPEGSGGQISVLDTITDPHAVDPETEAQASEVKDRLADAIESLPERERLVIALYYYENLTLREIGEVLGVTESRVSQLHTKAVLGLRSRFGAAAFPDGAGALAYIAAVAHKPADRIRNVALIGHRGSGKTSLAEALLFEAGVVNRLGRVADGSTVFDFEPDEQEREMSIGAARRLVRVRRPQDQPDRHPGRPELHRRHARRPAGRRRRRGRDQRGDGRRGAHRAPLGTRRGGGAGSAGVRQHARPRAGGLLSHARVAEGAHSALTRWRPRSRSAPSTRCGGDRPDRHEGVRVRGGGGGAARDRDPEDLRARPRSTARS